LGIKPLSYAIEGALFAAASESVALLNLGFASDNIRSLLPGQMVAIKEGQLEIQRFAPSPRQAHCFFEWVYFSNVASTLDRRSVYMARKALGEELAELETVSLDEDTVVVPVPDTSKAAAAAMAYKLGVPCLEGLIRNRYSGRTFIEGGDSRVKKAQAKYTPLREVLEGKRVLLVEDSIVRATTLTALLERIWVVGQPREIHVRVACPPIISPCFYGIDMSTLTELFAPSFLNGRGLECDDSSSLSLADRGGCGSEKESGNELPHSKGVWPAVALTPEIEASMAAKLGATSLRYLPMESVARAIGLDSDQLCQACITGRYPTPCGTRLAQTAVENFHNGVACRTYETRSHGNGRNGKKCAPPADGDQSTETARSSPSLMQGH
jgi:amidophosphoribosyltransferase